METGLFERRPGTPSHPTTPYIPCLSLVAIKVSAVSTGTPSSSPLLPLLPSELAVLSRTGQYTVTCARWSYCFSRHCGSQAAERSGKADFQGHVGRAGQLGFRCRAGGGTLLRA